MEQPNKPLWEMLLRAERTARTTRWRKWMAAPLRYPWLMIYHRWIHPRFSKGIAVQADTFFGLPFHTILPSGTDVMLHGIKAHDSEIRLAKFLVRHLAPGDVFVDIGAHYGYYSLLAGALTGPSGRILAFEPSPASAEVFKKNVAAHPDITLYQAAASDQQREIVFYEYPGPLAEYNTTLQDLPDDVQLVAQRRETRVPALRPDDVLTAAGITNATVKIDAEGGELSVLRGLAGYLEHYPMVVIMEYLLADRAVSSHDQAVAYLLSLGYRTYAIDQNGYPVGIDDIRVYMKDHGLESDNLVFLRRG